MEKLLEERVHLVGEKAPDDLARLLILCQRGGKEGALPAAVSLAWMFFNPIVFKKPRSTKSWASRSVLGERVWQNRNQVPVPDHHRIMPQVTNLISSGGMLLAIWAVVVLSPWPAAFGVAFAYIGKSWYLDRMVWLYEDMRRVPEYGSWLY